jgi:RNA polymerase sigma factor (sigma-70 family)
MSANPETRESLILRLPTAADAQAWREFVDLYEPLVLRFAKRQGLQDADAREIAQNVLVAVAKAVDRWQPDQERGKFRAWLFRIARNQVINWVKKRTSELSIGRTGDLPELELVDPKANERDDIELEYRREMFRLAAAQVRDSFSEKSWEAFWKTSVLDESVEHVAKTLGMSAGAVYIARSRIVARIRSIIEQWELNHAI